MLTLEFHGCTIQCGQLLQSLGGNRVGVFAGPAVRVQYGYTAAIGLFEIGQLAAGTQSQNLVQIEEIGFASQAIPLRYRWSGVNAGSTPTFAIAGDSDRMV
ncbi:hypothetical protein [Rhodanobacter sp. C03]|uniref:hypothetical protein n=1 Tax=Rhodanobacter sp. C03 TaxID=1945858 RepID=UPI0020C3FED7|nr:hypothetical protein [Rhodanobacter sp. C03]